MKDALKNFSLRLLLILLIVTLSVPISFAQGTKLISGTVVDANSDPLIGVTIKVVNEQIGTVTDFDGEFTLNVKPNSTIEISYVGFETQIIQIEDQTTFNVVLVEDSEVLDEVVVIGYGSVKRSDLTGSVSSVSGKDLATIPVTTTAQALQGKAAGVNIVTSSGAPGASASITIRGGTSITQSTEPLYIVDGFEMNDALSNININDIESIEVLKDASSTAIYGSRGSNGIIMITTKSGKKGKTQVAYNTYFSFDKLSEKLDMMSDVSSFIKYQYEISELQGKTTQWSNVFDNGLGIDNPDFYTGVYGRINDRYGNITGINWQDEVFGGTAFTQSHNVSISTGSEKTQVLLSYNYSGQDGLLDNHEEDKNTLRAKVNSELYKGIRFDLNTMFSSKSTDGGGEYSGMKNVLLQPINGGTMFSLDEMLHTQTFPDFSGLDSSYDTANPLVQNKASTSNKRSRIFSVNAGLEFDFLKYFTWRTAGQYLWSSGKSTAFSDENSTSYIMDPVNTGINGSIGNSEYYRYQLTNTLNYNQVFKEKHKLGILLGHEITYYEKEENSISLKQFPYPNFGLDDISIANVSKKTSGHSRTGLVSVFARANYAFDNRYLITATIRGDGSSKFARGNQWGVFPSVAGAWRISEENFWKNNKIVNYVNNFKLRIGYGITGNNGIDNNVYYTKVSMSSYPINNTVGNPAYVLDGTLGNKNLKWETLNATNIGLDFSLFNSRVNVTAEWYNNEISDMLLESALPQTTGYKTQFQNIGKMRNRGWELSISSVNIHNKNFRWTTDLNLAFNRSKVISLEKGYESKTFTVGSNRSGTLNYYAIVGSSLGDMYGYVYDGIYTTDDFIQNEDGSLSLREGVVKPYSGIAQPGDIKFAADNDEGDQFTRKEVKIGNGAPDCIGGINNTFTYRGFDLTLFMNFSIGNDVYNATKHSMSPYALYQNVPTEFGNNYYHLIDPSTGKQATTLSQIKALNPNENSRKWSLGKTNSSYITYPSSYFVEDGSYLRLAQLTIGYTLPEKLTRKAMISNARIYFTINNLATITGYSGYDPETSAANDNIVCTPGYDSSTYPRSRSYVVGFNLTF